MNTPENLAAQMAAKTNDQLSAMFKTPNDWLPEALDAARVELQQRGVDASTILVGPPPTPQGQPAFFCSFTTQAYRYVNCDSWHLRALLVLQELEAHQAADREQHHAILASIFGVIFCYSCFREVKEVATSRGISFPWSPGLLAAGWILLTLTWRLPDPYWFVCCLSPLVLVPVQNVVSRLNAWRPRASRRAAVAQLGFARSQAS